ncbi:hypothetical protein CEXT_439011 [Caerostris extrusa]|uniref:Uncharacterized protein n=1 Tax=Caerostris extrusa TaxID=172846 RepID=A0AAV4NVQ0_CAEEX|nr:hypothetical protein CEXT_439011 [Caerostris extrusa]
MFFVVLLVGFSSALPSPMMSDEPGVPLPEYRVLSQKLNETGIEMCEDMLHLCPATADCCKKDDGKWDCCPKQAAIGDLNKPVKSSSDFLTGKARIDTLQSKLNYHYIYADVGYGNPQTGK